MSYMTKQNIKFSIIIPVFNREHLVADTIRSVLNQSYSLFEIIAVNDGSTDNTLQVLDSFGTTLKTVNQQNLGPEVARNTGVEHATGDYLVFLDSDDILLPGALSIYSKIIENESYPALVFAKGKAFNSETGYSALKGGFQQQICYSCTKDYYSKRESVWLSTSFLLFKKSLWCSSTNFKKGTFPVDDLDFMLRSGTANHCIIVRSPETVGYRYHEGNSIKDISRNIERLHYIIKLEREGEYPGGLRRKIERLTLIAGHILNWSKKGFKKHLYRESLFLLIKGAPEIIVGILKKTINLYSKPLIKFIDLNR